MNCTRQCEDVDNTKYNTTTLLEDSEVGGITLVTKQLWLIEVAQTSGTCVCSELFPGISSINRNEDEHPPNMCHNVGGEMDTTSEDCAPHSDAATKSEECAPRSNASQIEKANCRFARPDGPTIMECVDTYERRWQTGKLLNRLQTLVSEKRMKTARSNAQHENASALISGSNASDQSSGTNASTSFSKKGASDQVSGTNASASFSQNNERDLIPNAISRDANETWGSAKRAQLHSGNSERVQTSATNKCVGSRNVGHQSSRCIFFQKHEA